MATSDMIRQLCEEMMAIAEMLGVNYEQSFVLANGEKILLRRE